MAFRAHLRNNYDHRDGAEVDMDAPQISTLPQDEQSPSPTAAQQARTTKFRVKLVVNEDKDMGGPSAAGSTAGDDGDEEDVDELIDDVDDAHSATSGTRPPFTTTPLKGRKERVPRGKSDKPRKRRSDKFPPAAPVMETFESTFELVPQNRVPEIVEVDPLAPPKPRKRRKANADGPLRKTASKASSATHLSASVSLADDQGALSDVDAYSGTAASSPPRDLAPELEPESFIPSADFMPSADLTPSAVNIPDPFSTAISASAPVPTYPLPTKPFSVMPPVKVGTGFSPVVPLDRTPARVRHWRKAHREVRGIAGGRWFAKTWVGDKQSAYADATRPRVAQSGAGTPTPAQVQALADTNSTAMSAVSLPKLASIALSASGGVPSPSSGMRSKGGSGPGSRSGSVISDMPHTSAVRAPTKMRTSVVAPPQSPEGPTSISAALRS